MSRPGLVEMEAVLSIARRGSFRAAALELGLSTTALSHAIAKLERDLGVRLFNRTTRSVSLTDAGRSFVAAVGPALQDIHAAIDAARAHQATPTGTLRINAFAAAAREIFSPLLLQFVQRYPQVHVDLVTEGGSSISSPMASTSAFAAWTSFRPTWSLFRSGATGAMRSSRRPATSGPMANRRSRQTCWRTPAFASGCRTAVFIAGGSRRTASPSMWMFRGR